MAGSRQQGPPARTYHESVGLKDRMIVWGGATNKHKTDECHSRLHMFSVDMLTGKWRQHTAIPPDTPPPCIQACSAAIANTVYSYGGKTTSGMSHELYKIDLGDLRWRKINDRGNYPLASAGAKMCSLNGSLLLMGGYNSKQVQEMFARRSPLYLSENYKGKYRHTPSYVRPSKWSENLKSYNGLLQFDPREGRWFSVSVTGPMPSPRSGHTLTDIGDHWAILFGGNDGKEDLRDLWLFDYRNHAWTEIIPLASQWPQSRRNHTVCKLMCDNPKPKLLLMGGVRSVHENADDCWLLDVNEGISHQVTLDPPADRLSSTFRKKFNASGHSAHSATLSNGTVVVSVYGGQPGDSRCANFYQWRPGTSNALYSGLPAAGAAIRSPLFGGQASICLIGSEQIPKLREDINQLSGHLKNERSKVKKVTAENDQLTAAFARLTSDNDQLTKRVSTMTKDTESLNAQLLQEGTNVRQLTAANDHLTAAFARLTSDNDQLTKTVSTMKKDTESLNAQLLQEGTSVRQMTAENNQLTAAFARLTSDNDQLTKRVSTMKKDTESLNAQLLQERTNVRQLTAANDQLTAANTQLTAANQKLSGKVSIMTEEKQSLQNLNSQLTQESKYMKQLTEANEQLAAAKNQLSERVRNMNEEKQSLQSLNSQLNQESAQLSENLRKVNEDKVFLLQMTKTLRKEREDKQTQLHCKQRDTETINGETEETRKAMEHMKTEKEELQLKMGESEQRLKEVEQQLKTSETAREIAERKLADSNQILNIPFKDVQLNNKELGSGSYGGVYLGYWRGSPVAVKILHEDLAKEQYQRRLFEQEAAIYSRLHHPNITAICGVIQERDAPFSLVMELLQASMAEVIEAALFSGRYLTLREKTDVSHDCLSGLMYIHELPHPVLHGDIRPTNILMTSMMRAKLGDLGSARFAESSLSAGPMSPLYVAPERFADRTLPNSKAADVYSMGVCLSELFTGSQLDQADRPRQLSSVKQRDLRLVCIMMANRDVQQRMTASAALPVNDRVSKTDEYKRCDPRRMVRGIADGVGNVTLCDKAW